MNKKISFRISHQGLMWVLFALVLRLFVGTAIHFYSQEAGYRGFYPHPLGSDDEMYYNFAVDMLNREVTRSELPNTYPAYLTALFQFTGPSLVAGKALNILLSSLMCYFGFLIALLLSKNLNISVRSLLHPANVTAFFIAVHPSALFNSTQLLKDPFLLFFGMWAIYLIFRILMTGGHPMHWALLLLNLFCIYGIRPYMTFVIVFSIVLYTFFIWRAKLKLKLILASVSIVLIAVVPYYMGTGWFAMSLLQHYLDAETLAETREISYGGGSAMNIIIDFDSPIGFLRTYGYSYLSAMFGPFPWQVKSGMQLMAMVESFGFWLLIPLWARSIWNLRRSRREEDFLLIFTLLFVGVIALFSDNLGTNVRLRSLPWYTFLIYAMITIYRKRAVRHASASPARASRRAPRAARLGPSPERA